MESQPGIRPAAYSEIVTLRESFRREANCQIVRDSIMRRGLADGFALLSNKTIVGYAGVWNVHFPHRIMEFYLLPNWRGSAIRLIDVLKTKYRVKEIEAQTNIPSMAKLLRETAVNVWDENLLFSDGPETHLEYPGAVFRRRRPGDSGPEGEWVIELNGQVTGAGGILTHYNPPYGDIYLEIEEDFRLRGLGSYLVQKLRRVCREKGLKPAARCNPGNNASQRTLLKGGLERCGRLIAGSIIKGHTRGLPSP